MVVVAVRCCRSSVHIHSLAVINHLVEQKVVKKKRNIPRHWDDISYMSRAPFVAGTVVACIVAWKRWVVLFKLLLSLSLSKSCVDSCWCCWKMSNSMSLHKFTCYHHVQLKLLNYYMTNIHGHHTLTSDKWGDTTDREGLEMHDASASWRPGMWSAS